VAAELTLLSGVSYRGEDITAPRLRGLLALLAGDLRTGCSTARLVDGLWPDEQPENPTKAVQIVVSRARSQLGADVIANTATGYRLALDEDQVDASAVLVRASASAQRARAGDHAAALAQAEAGLALWDGVPAVDAGSDDPLSALRSERLATYRSLVRARALALSRLHRYAEAVDPLADLARKQPRDEEVLLELLRCEAATTGPSAALVRYESYRRSLRDDLGTDPGPALQSLQRDLLQGTTPAVRSGVHEEPNELLGRATDVAAVTKLLRTSRVTSIVGPGGLGKTRLAHAVSREAQQRVVHLVPLAGLADDADVAAEVASALGVGDPRRAPIAHPGTPAGVASGIVNALGAGPALLVLDNCEHLVKGVAELVQALVSATRDLRVLTTSRAPLDLSSESVYLLPELDLATAVELFGQRATAARPGVALPADAVMDIVRHLDGLPLAVELAAARVRVMSVPEIAERLTDRFALLRGGPRDVPERHRTLHAVVDWSWNLLQATEQSAMRALSVFPGGFDADGAGALLGSDPLPVLAQLVDRSLLKASDTAAGTRFQMLDTVREFATARRTAAGETDQVTDGFLAWARELGERHHESLFGPDPFSTVDTIRAEQDNLVQALRQALTRGDNGTVAAVAAVLQSLWIVESNYTRVGQLTDETAWALSHYRPEPDLVEVTRSALTISTTYTFLIQGPRAVRSLVALRRLPHAPPTTLTRAAAVVVLAVARDPAALFALAESDDPLVAGAANGVASYVWENTGALERAEAAARRMLDMFSPRDMPWLATVARARIAELCLQLERGDESLRQLTAALPVCDRLGPSYVIGLRWWMVLANLQLGALDEAEHWLAQTDAGGDDPVAHTYGLGVRAEIQLATGRVDAGLALWRRAIETLDGLRDPAIRRFASDVDPWTLEAQAVTAVAHARHGQLDKVRDVVDQLPRHLTAVLANPVPNPPPYLLEFAVSGAVLLALAAVDLAEGRAAGTAARMVALAERFRYLRAFQPTMSSARARQAAEQADKAAYDDAVSSYADLGREELRAAALDLLHARNTG
jgi:predicted ATPase/DNA-binding SARP family transcriptional activator